MNPKRTVECSSRLEALDIRRERSGIRRFGTLVPLLRSTFRRTFAEPGSTMRVEGVNRGAFRREGAGKVGHSRSVRVQYL